MTIATLLLACGTARLPIDDAEPPPGPPPEPPPLALTLEAPAPYSFAGAGPIEVVGRASSPLDVVTVEGAVVPVAEDGSFRATVVVLGEARVVTVTAQRGDEELVKRRTVYAGDDPRDSWPGALGVRVTPAGLDQLTVGIEAQVDAIDLPGLLSAVIPPTVLGGFAFTPVSGTADPVVVTLAPVDGELLFELSLPNFELAFEAVTGILPPVPVVLGVEDFRIGATLALASTPEGLSLDLVDTTVALDGPVLEFAGIDPLLLEFLAGGLFSFVGTAIETALDLGLVPLTELVLPTLALETDALGFPLALSLDGLLVDEGGVLAELGVELGTEAVASPRAPGADDAPPGTDFALSLHEGLIGALLSGDVLSALDLGTLELPGFLGEIVALPLTALPGGGELPADRTGMCITLGLPSGGIARVRGGLEPLAVLILPDLSLQASVSTPEALCSPWLDANLVVLADLTAQGSSLVIDLEIADGAVLSYAAEGAWSEDEVVGGLGGLIGAVSTLVGSSLAIDLSTLVDPALLGGTAAITSSRVPEDAAGDPVPGVVVVGLTVE